MRSPAALLGALLAAALVAASEAALASGTPGELFAEGERASSELAFDRALARYDAVVTSAPASPEAALAATRASYLRARAEGGFAPLARLERTRRDPARASEATEIDALVRDAEAFPAGTVRVEAWAFASEAYAERLGRPEEARRLRERILGDAHADDVLVGKAARDLVDAALARGDVAAAEEVEARAGSRAPGDLRKLVARARRRVHARRASFAAIGLACAASAAALRRGSRASIHLALRRAAVPVLAFAAWTGGMGAALARAYDGSDARPFLVLALAVVPVCFVARATAASGAASRTARASRAFAFAAAALGVAFLVLEGTDPRYLEGIGL